MMQNVDHVATSDCPEPGSFHSKLAFVLELSTGKLQKCKKRNIFDTKSLQIGELPTGSSKYVKNLVLFGKHNILRNEIKPSCFAQFPWSSNLNLSIVLQLSIDLHKKLWSYQLDFFVKKTWSSELKMHSFLGVQTYRGKLPWKRISKSNLWRKLPWKWLSRSHLR